MVENPVCTLCGEEMPLFKYKPMKEWDVNGLLCSRCYDKKLIEHYVAPDRRNVTKR